MYLNVSEEDKCSAYKWPSGCTVIEYRQVNNNRETMFGRLKVSTQFKGKSFSQNADHETAMSTSWHILSDGIDDLSLKRIWETAMRARMILIFPR